MKRNTFAKYGQTMIELMIVTVIAGVLISAIVFSGITSSKLVRSTKTSTIARQFAQDGLETARKLRDESWTNVFSRVGSAYCLGEDRVLVDQISGACPYTVSTMYSRTVTFSEHGTPADGIIQVTVVVSWIDSEAQVKNITLSSFLSDWRD